MEHTFFYIKFFNRLNVNICEYVLMWVSQNSYFLCSLTAKALENNLMKKKDIIWKLGIRVIVITDEQTFDD